MLILIPSLEIAGTLDFNGFSGLIKKQIFPSESTPMK